jgi:hypothetical protein
VQHRASHGLIDRAAQEYPLPGRRVVLAAFDDGERFFGDTSEGHARHGAPW